MVTNSLGMLKYFRRIGVLLLRHVANFIKQGQVTVGFDIALSTRVAIPVPGTAEITTGFNNADIFNSSFFEPGGGHQPTEPSTDDGNSNIKTERIAIDLLHIGVRVCIFSELRCCFYVLVFTIFADSLVTL